MIESIDAILDFMMWACIVYFGAGFVIMFLIWPVNDNEDEAPLYVMIRWVKRMWSKLK